jgi:Ca2+-binding RTX toxin-like protein
MLVSREGGNLFGDDGDDTLRGGEVDTWLTGGKGADRFICGSSASNAIITDFNAAEGDTKSESCENVLEESVSTLDNNNDDNNSNTTETDTTTTTSTTPSSGVAEDSQATEEDASSLPGTTTTITSSSSSDDAIETRGVTETVEAQTMEVLPDEKP